MSGQTSPRRRRILVIGILALLVSLPWTVPRLLLGVAEGALWVVDQQMDRGGLPSAHCGDRVSDDFDAVASTVISALGGEPFHGWVQTLDWNRSYDSGRCQAFERWLRNRGLPTRAVFAAEIEKPGPRLVVSRARKRDAWADWLYVASFMSRGSDGKAVMSLAPEQNSFHRKIVQLLSPGMPEFAEANARNQIANIVAAFPAPCLNRTGTSFMHVILELEPQGARSWFHRLAQEQPQLEAINVWGCLSGVLPQCSYRYQSALGPRPGFSTVKEVLIQCREATVAAVQRGEAYSDWVYATYPVPKEPDTSEAGF